MSRSDPQMSIRLPGDLKPRLVEAARTNGRTINAEIVSRLDRSFAAGQTFGLSEDAVAAILETRAIVGQLLTLKALPGAPKPLKRKKTV
jgi:predicted DNA-binding protein